MPDTVPSAVEIEQALTVLRTAYVASPEGLERAWRRHRTAALAAERGWLALDVLVWAVVAQSVQR
jgi:hypothetical protein